MKGKVKSKTVIVLCVAVVLLGGMIILFATANQGYDEEVTGGDIPIGDKNYQKKPLTTILFIGVGETARGDSYPEAVYLTLLSIDNKARTYFTVNLPCDSIVTVYPYQSLGAFSEEGKEERLGRAQCYGDGKNLSCLCTARAVSMLLRGISIDYYLCLPAVSGEPVFTSDVVEQLEQIRHALVIQEDESDAETSAPYLCMTLTETSLEAILNSLAVSTSIGNYTPRGETVGGAEPRFILDKEDLEANVLKYFFEGASGT